MEALFLWLLAWVLDSVNKKKILQAAFGEFGVWGMELYMKIYLKILDVFSVVQLLLPLVVRISNKQNATISWQKSSVESFMYVPIDNAVCRIAQLH